MGYYNANFYIIIVMIGCLRLPSNHAHQSPTMLALLLPSTLDLMHVRAPQCIPTLNRKTLLVVMETIITDNRQGFTII